MNIPPSRNPGASIIIPSYESHGTIAATLQSLRGQVFSDFEIIVVDSGPNNTVAKIAADFPDVRYHRSEERLLPHEARNIGVKLARSKILVFTDPDVVAAPDWLETLLATFRKSAGPVVGAVASLQRGWLEIGIHIAKFDLWLPGGRERNVPIAMTANFLCPLPVLSAAAGFEGCEMIGDTLLSWELLRLGHTLRFAPGAIVYHDHRSTFEQLLRERFVRGADFARLRMRNRDWKTIHTMAVLIASVVPLRLAKLAARSIMRAARAGCLSDCLRSLPVVMGGHVAWLAGEISQYWRHLFPASETERKIACAL